MSHSNDGSERRLEEDIIEPRSASNESEFSNQPHRDLVEGLSATPFSPQPSDQLSIPSVQTEQYPPRQGLVPSLSEASNQHPIPRAEPEPNATSRKTLFGLKKQVGKQSVPTHFNRFDYEQKYPRDPFGQERAENARVWLTYLDEAESYDRDKIDGWKATVDVLLVFAGLFSAVVSTFLSQVSQNLQQNFTQVSASLLYEIAQLQRAQLTGSSIADIPTSPLTPNTPFTPSTYVSSVNGLWFSSLAISLCSALLAVLARQWLYYYQSPVSGTAREKVMVRQFRFVGLEKWRVALIIDLLPTLLHLALGLFLVGLVVLILPLDIRIVWTIVILSGFTYILYFISIILPIWHSQCPYVTPLTIYIGSFIQLVWSIRPQLPDFDRVCLIKLSIYRDRLFSRTSFRGFRCSFHLVGSTISKTATQVWTFLKSKITTSSALRLASFHNWRESQLWGSIDSSEAMLEDEAHDWLLSTSSNPAVYRIIARSAFKSPNFVKRLELYHLLVDDDLYNPRFADEWDEDSLRILLDDSEFLEDLCHTLYLIFISGHDFDHNKFKIVSFIQEGSASLLEDIKAGYPELFSIITIWEKDDVEVLLTGLRDNTLKLREDIWVCLLERAWEDKELASEIISSGTFNLFNWDEQPSWRTRHNHRAIPLANQLPQQPDLDPMYLHSSSSELNRSGFSYLFRYFFEKRFPDDDSFESRHRLFIAVYWNLVTDEPLIADPTLREKALKCLLLAFSSLASGKHRCIEGQVITPAFLNKLWHDLLLHDSFFGGNMSLDVQTVAVHCFEQFWTHRMRMTGDFSPFFTTQHMELQFIYQWCSKGNPCASLVQHLFMPGSLSNLHIFLLGDYDRAKSSLKNCLRLLLWSSRSLVSRKHVIFYEDHIIPHVLRLFTAAIRSNGSDRLFSILSDPSVLAQAWKLLVTYPLFLELHPKFRVVIPSPIKDRSRALSATISSRLDSNSLKKVYDRMIGYIESPDFDSSLGNTFILNRAWRPEEMRKLCTSAYIFGRMAGLIMDPNTFNFPSSIIDRQAFRNVFKDVRDMRNVLEREFMEEKRKHSRLSLFPFLRVSRTSGTLLRKNRPEAGMELEAATRV